MNYLLLGILLLVLRFRTLIAADRMLLQRRHHGVLLRVDCYLDLAWLSARART